MKAPRPIGKVRRLGDIDANGACDRIPANADTEAEAKIMERLRTMGPCPQGFSWFRSGNGWRCGGGSHFVYDDDPILSGD